MFKGNIIFHSNILSKEDVPFINSLIQSFSNNGYNLVLTGWNVIPIDWELKTKYYKLPHDIHCFEPSKNIESIKSELHAIGININSCLKRFNWWFTDTNDFNRNKRIALLHFHLHHYSKLVKKYNPGLIMLWNGNDPRHMIFNAIAKIFEIKVVFFERGPLPSMLFYDLQGILSHSSVNDLKIVDILKFKKESSKLTEYLNWYNKSDETLWKQPEANNINLRTLYNIPNDKKITLFVGQIDNDIQTKVFSPFFKSNLEALKYFLENCLDENFFVVGKHHPMNNVPVEVFQKEVDSFANVIWTDEVHLDACLDQVDNVVAVNSSVIFDALLMHKPVLSLGKTMLDGKEILYEYFNGEKVDVLKNFYSAQDFQKRHINYSKLLNHMFDHNLLFTKNYQYADEYAGFADNIFEIKQNNDDFMVNELVLKEYERNSLIKNRQRLTLLQKIRNLSIKNLKKIYIKIFKS